jgi:hypothetical protein
MDTGRLLKLIVVVALVVAGWKFGKPWLEQKFGGNQAAAISSAGSCVRSAEQASEAWGSGLRQFVNPPVDLGAWSSFRNGVDVKINEAETDCGCESQSCMKAKEAMRDLRGLVADFDNALRNNQPLDDVVQRQEAIDMKINTASALSSGGK